jgi:hypothetical protein
MQPRTPPHAVTLLLLLFTFGLNPGRVLASKVRGPWVVKRVSFHTNSRYLGRERRERKRGSKKTGERRMLKRRKRLKIIKMKIKMEQRRRREKK